MTVRNAALQFGTNENVTAEVFWEAVDAYSWYGAYMAEAGGTSYNYVTNTGEGSFSFTADNEFPNLSDEDIVAFLQPLWDSLRDIGVEVRDISVTPTSNWARSSNNGTGDSPGNQRFGSRLFPKSSWEDDAAFETMMGAIKDIVEAGYTFHGIYMNPTEEVGGWPGSDSGLNPVFRDTYMHADIFFAGSIYEDEPYETLMQRLREATPGGGAYVNESDVEEPNFQESFWGEKYEKLYQVKRERDPWGVFWAPSTVGSETWAVESEGLVSQDGPLCRVKKRCKRSKRRA